MACHGCCTLRHVIFCVVFLVFFKNGRISAFEFISVKTSQIVKEALDNIHDILTVFVFLIPLSRSPWFIV